MEAKTLRTEGERVGHGALISSFQRKQKQRSVDIRPQCLFPSELGLRVYFFTVSTHVSSVTCRSR